MEGGVKQKDKTWVMGGHYVCLMGYCKEMLHKSGILLSFSQNHLIANFEFVFYWNTEEENVQNALVTFIV